MGQWTESYYNNNNLRSYISGPMSDPNEYSNTWTYDTNNIILSLTNNEFDTTGSTIKIGDSTYYYFGKVVDAGIAKLSNNNALYIYPNPGNGLFQLEINPDSYQDEEPGVKSRVEVYNTLGEEVYSSFSTFHFPLSINLSAQAQGIYFIHVITDKGTFTGKIVLQK